MLMWEAEPWVHGPAARQGGAHQSMMVMSGCSSSRSSSHSFLASRFTHCSFTVQLPKRGHGLAIP